MSLNGVVKQVKLLDTINPNLHVCEIEIDFDNLIIFENYNSLQEFVNERVTYDVRGDIYKGEFVSVVVNLTRIYKVQTVDVEDVKSLIVDSEETNIVVNLDPDEIAMNDRVLGRVTFLSGYEEKRSPKSTWLELVCIDKKSRVHYIKLFRNLYDVESEIKDLVGRYIVIDVERDRYGLRATEISLYDHPVVLSKEVEVAYAMLSKVVDEDEMLREYVDKYNMLDELRNTIHYEIGYHLVEMATELCLINTLEKVSNIYDVETLRRAIFCSRAHLVGNVQDRSNYIVNYHKLITSVFKNDSKLISIIDIMNVTPSIDRDVYLKVRNMVATIVNVKRGVEVIEEINSSVVNIRNFTNGMC